MGKTREGYQVGITLDRKSALVRAERFSDKLIKKRAGDETRPTKPA
jgi:hypothetical protein